ncbi:MAG: CinA family protein [Betaproteobacteria bacterium]|nr:CinA family protein [Betaproteobacteria bacterium]
MNDLDALSAAVGEALSARSWMLATAESCTGGGVAECVTRTAGSSAWFDRGFITYTNAAKRELLGVAVHTLDNFGAVSEEAAAEMAQGALRESGAQISLAVTGIAGPGGGSTTKPVGLVCFAWSLLDGGTHTARHQFTGDRANIRKESVIAALSRVIVLAR